MLVVLSILMLLGLSSVTVRSNLESLLRESRKAISALSRPQEQASGSQPLAIDIEMTETRFKGRLQAAGHKLPPQSMHRIRQAMKDAELAKWKAVELFKVT